MDRRLQELQFHDRWFDSGLLPASFFKQQLELYLASDATEHRGWKHVEHHHYAAFQAILATHAHLSDLQIEQYIGLAQLEPTEAAITQPVLIDLLLWKGLSSEQFETLSKQLLKIYPITRKIVWRKWVTIEIQRGPVSETLFNEILDHKDAAIERLIATHTMTSREQLQKLATDGTNRAVRNIAGRRLKLSNQRTKSTAKI